jgi:hypothetical protein
VGRLSLSAIACSVLFAFGCDDVPVVTPQPVETTGGLGGAASQGGAGGQGADGGPTTGAGGALVAPVLMGVRANVSAAAPPLLADLRAYAAGVRLMPIAVRFGNLDEAVLAEDIADHAAQQVRVVVTLLVVDGPQAFRPPGLEEVSWNDPLMKVALGDAIDAIEGAGAVDVIAIGRRVDRYLEAFPADGEALAELLAHGVSSADTPTGIGLGHESQPDPVVESIASLGDVSVRSYLPGLGGSVQLASVAMDLDALVATAGERPVLLLDVAFPSAPALGASEEMQHQALDAFFTALEPRRSRFPWVVVHQLHDLDELACEALAIDQGEDPGGLWASYACHTGLRTPEDEPKPAWSRFLEATARFASP